MITVDETPSFTPWWRRLERSDRWAITWLLVVPVLLFVIPAFFGRPAIDADNLIQNFPLRVLAGRQIASGHLPLLDPLTNAGTPLLGGMNAGALYPLTLIFAFVPAIAAWLINVIVVYVVAAWGVFALLRWHGLRTWASFVAALSYAYSGAMIGQLVHLGVVQGYSFLPWEVLVMLALSRRLRQERAEATWRELARVATPWTCAVALIWGLTFLTGEPRAIAVAELLVIVVTPAVLVLRTSFWLSAWRARVVYVATLFVGFVWGVGLGLAQLLPGWSFINFSQRSQENYAFFGAGSLPLRWSALLFSPDLFGGNGAFGQRGYFVNYNLAEVTGYAGVVALVALGAFMTRLTRRGWRAEERDFTIYVVIAVVGLFATWGNFTPLGHLFRAIPLFGATRLQSRNVVLVDFALSIVLGWWLHHVRDENVNHAGLGEKSRWITALPALFVVAFSVALLAWGSAVIRDLGVPVGAPRFASSQALTTALHLVLALLVVGAVLWGRRSRRLFAMLVVLLVLDLTAFVMFTATGLVGGPGAREPSRVAAQALLGTKGRFALVDPSGQHTGVYRELGQPNMNVFTGLASVQGYGALISTIYDDATGTHPQAMLNPCRLADGTFSQLRLGAIAISASELSQSTARSAGATASCVPNRVEPSTRRYFGRLLRVRSIILTSTFGHVMSKGPLTLQLLSRVGRLVGPVVAATGETTKKAVFDFSRPRLASGFVVTSPSGVVVGSAVVTPEGAATSYQLNTAFQLAVSTSSWRLTSTQDRFSIFHATSVRAPVWLQGPIGTGHVTNIREASWGDAWVTTKVAAPRVLVRSEAYLPGWRATAVNDVTHRVVDLAVYRDGLIQSVRVPEGTWTIHFHYHAPYIEVGAAASAASVLLLIGVASILEISRRRRRNAKVHS